MSELWPAGLQEKLNVSGFGMEFGDTTVRSEMGVGPDKVRSRSTKGIDKFSSTIDVTFDEYTTIYNFYTITLAQGTKFFTFPHPFTGIDSDFRFTTPPTLSPKGGLYFTCNMAWELLP